MDGAKLRNQLLGGHVARYMRRLQDKNPEEFQSHFSRFLKEGLTPDSLEEMYKKAHAGIREDPTRKPRAKVSYAFVDHLFNQLFYQLFVVAYNNNV